MPNIGDLMRTLASALAATLIAGFAAVPVSAELVKLQPRPGVELRIAVEAPRGAAAAYALLFAGGHGKIELDERGEARGLRRNFLARARQILKDRGIGVVMVDAPSDHQGESGLWPIRTQPVHGADIGQIVRLVRQRFGRPVWLVGNSAGSPSVANGAARLVGVEAPDGVVLTSSLTLPPSRPPRRPVSVFDVSLGAYRGATLVVAHEGDTCAFTPPGDAARILAAFAAARPKKLLMVKGGAPRQSEPCESLSEHGFLGIEAQVMNAIADFILRPGG